METIYKAKNFSTIVKKIFKEKTKEFEIQNNYSTTTCVKLLGRFRTQDFNIIQYLEKRIKDHFQNRGLRISSTERNGYTYFKILISREDFKELNRNLK